MRCFEEINYYKKLKYPIYNKCIYIYNVNQCLYNISYNKHGSRDRSMSYYKKIK